MIGLTRTAEQVRALLAIHSTAWAFLHFPLSRRKLELEALEPAVERVLTTFARGQQVFVKERFRLELGVADEIICFEADYALHTLDTMDRVASMRSGIGRDREGLRFSHAQILTEDLARLRYEVRHARVVRPRDLTEPELLGAGIRMPSFDAKHAAIEVSGKFPTAQYLPKGRPPGPDQFTTHELYLAQFAAIWDRAYARYPGCTFAEAWAVELLVQPLPARTVRTLRSTTP